MTLEQDRRGFRGFGANPPASSLAFFDEREAQSLADDDCFTGLRLAPSGREDLPVAPFKLAKKKPFPLAASRLAMANQPRGDNLSVVPNEDVAGIQKLGKLKKPSMLDRITLATHDHQTRSVARLDGMLRDQGVGKVEIEGGGVQEDSWGTRWSTKWLTKSNIMVEYRFFIENGAKAGSFQTLILATEGMTAKRVWTGREGSFPFPPAERLNHDA